MEKNYNGWNNRNSRSSGPGKAKGEPVRVQRKRTKGWKMPENTVYVGRPGKWGNMHKVGVSLVKEPKESKYDYRHATPDDAVKMYEETIKYWIEKDPKKYDISELKGKNLACFCSLDQPCHADVLLKISNK